MIFLPLLYFLFLTIFWWIRHKRIDVCVYMSALYTITSFFAVVLVMGDMLGAGGILFDSSDAKFQFLPTLIYCAFLTLSIMPFSMIYGKDIKKINPTYEPVLTVLSLFLFAIALLNLYLVADSTLEILSGDLSTVRSDHYSGILSPAQVKAQSMPFFVRALYYFNNTTILALPIMFYNISYKLKPWWFNMFLFLTSLSVPLAGIQAADRTETVFYAMMFVYCLIFFWRTISKKLKRYLFILGIPVLTAFVIYFVAVTDARFSEKNGGAVESAMQYVGQGYLNFCFFWENADPNQVSVEREFPFIHHYFFRIDSNPERRSVRSGKQGFFISVFPSFMGDILLDMSFLGATIWIMYYFLILFLIIKCAHRDSFDISEVLILFYFAAIPVFGIFYYRYYNHESTLILLITAILYLITRVKYFRKKTTVVSKDK